MLWVSGARCLGCQDPPASLDSSLHSTLSPSFHPGVPGVLGSWGNLDAGPGSWRGPGSFLLLWCEAGMKLPCLSLQVNDSKSFRVVKSMEDHKAGTEGLRHVGNSEFTLR